MVGRKRKTVVSKEGSLEQASHWSEFQNQIKDIEPRRCTAWVDISEVVGQGGVTEIVHWRYVLWSGVSPGLKVCFLVNSKRVKSSEDRPKAEYSPTATEVSLTSPTNNGTAEEVPKIFR